MGKAGFFFFTGDWLKDTRTASLEVRGAWIDLLCLLYENNGEITCSYADLAHYWGTLSAKCPLIVRELSRLNLASVAEMSPGVVTIMSRRMRRDHFHKENKRLSKKKERERKHVARMSPSMSPSCRPDVADPYLNLNPSPSLHLKKDAVPASPAPSADLVKKTVPEWAPIADRLFKSATRYSRIYGWIHTAERYATGASIAKALSTLEAFEQNTGPVNDWYPYLSALLKKQKADDAAEDFDKKNQELKNEEEQWLKKLKAEE